MTTSKDQQRSDAFRQWVATIPGDADSAAAQLQINRRKIGRMISGKVPPPARLLEELAARAFDAGRSKLARQLMIAAQPAPQSNGHEITGAWFDECEDEATRNVRNA